MKQPLKHQVVADEPELLAIDSIPFSISERGARHRRQEDCEYQHILFVLDTSGSITGETFNKLTALLGDLVVLFCKPISVAVMTFDNQYYMEFCFNEFDNSPLGRDRTNKTIRSIPYVRPGRECERARYTHTAGAARCICDYVFGLGGQEERYRCGLDLASAPCVDVVFITDGQANDPELDVCETVQCLHDKSTTSTYNVNTYAIGVGFVDTHQLECMIDNDLKMDEYHLFNFDTYDELQMQFQKAVDRLANDITGTYTCVSTSVDPAGK